jgi:ABC-type sugar transport system substrate-binding protein
MSLHSSARTGRRRLVGSLVAVALPVALVLSGCSGSAAGAGTGAPADESIDIGVMLFNTDLPFYAPLQDGIRAEAEELGVTVDIQNGQLDPARQAQLVQQFVTQGKDAIIISASDADAIVPAVTQANAAGIPVLGLTNDIGEGADRLTYVGSDNVKFGYLLAQGAAEVAGPDARIAIIMGALGTTSQRERSEGIAQYVAENPGIEIVAEQTANWDNAQALKVGQDLLAKYPPGTLDAILCEGPEGAAAAKYAASAGRKDVKFIVGDTSQDVMAQLQAGTIAATAFQNFFDQGGTAIQYAVDAAQGKSAEVPQPNAYAPIELYTAADVAKIPDNSLF